MSTEATTNTLIEGEVNKGIYVRVGFNPNEAPFTLLRLTFTSPDGLVTIVRDSPDVQAPTVDSPEIKDASGVTVIIPANTYVLYKTQDGDGFTAGTWGVCFYYEDAVPSIYKGKKGTLIVEAECA